VDDEGRGVRGKDGVGMRGGMGMGTVEGTEDGKGGVKRRWEM
jgi:hypothetical protein